MGFLGLFGFGRLFGIPRLGGYRRVFLRRRRINRVANVDLELSGSDNSADLDLAGTGDLTGSDKSAYADLAGIVELGGTENADHDLAGNGNLVGTGNSDLDLAGNGDLAGSDQSAYVDLAGNVELGGTENADHDLAGDGNLEGTGNADLDLVRHGVLGTESTDNVDLDLEVRTDFPTEDEIYDQNPRNEGDDYHVVRELDGDGEDGKAKEEQEHGKTNEFGRDDAGLEEECSGVGQGYGAGVGQGQRLRHANKVVNQFVVRLSELVCQFNEDTGSKIEFFTKHCTSDGIHIAFELKKV